MVQSLVAKRPLREGVGQRPTLPNSATPFQRSQIMRFRVNLPFNRSMPIKPLPSRLGGPFSVPGQIARRRFLTLEVNLDPSETPLALLLNGMHFADGPVTERLNLGDTEVWALINLSADTHPIHLHLVQFKVQACNHRRLLSSPHASEVDNPSLALVAR
jgi:hypothetical protein